MPVTGPGLPFFAGERPIGFPGGCMQALGSTLGVLEEPVVWGRFGGLCGEHSPERAPAGRAAPAQSRVLEDRS